MEKQDVLQKCTIEGNIVKLPEGQLDRKLYQEVAKALTLIGGKWNGAKTMGFVFNEDPTELLSQIANGEQRNLKKEYQFFATPKELAKRMVDFACLNACTGGILEPSAGQGAIINEILKHPLHNTVFYYELMDINKVFLDKIPGAIFIAKDFLNENDGMLYQRIIANPPFSKNQDIDHIMQMYNNLDSNGILVSIASKHWVISSNKKETEFKDFLLKVSADVIDIPAGEFKESGTSIATCMIVIRK